MAAWLLAVLGLAPLGLSYGRLGLAMAVLGLVPLGYGGSWLGAAWLLAELGLTPLGLGC